MHDNRFHFINDIDDATVEVRVRGGWDRRLRADLYVALTKCLAQAPRAVLVDLQELDDPTGRCITTLLAAHHAGASAVPPVRFIACGATFDLTERFTRVGLGRVLPVCPDVSTAKQALHESLPIPSMRQVQLSPTQGSVALARELIGDACSEWGLGQLLHPGRLIVSELAQNAVEHARTPFTVAVSLRGRLLHLAVRDEHDALPQLRTPAPYSAATLGGRGRGLMLVRQHSAAWGFAPSRTGKVVWATLPTRAA